MTNNGDFDVTKNINGLILVGSRSCDNCFFKHLSCDRLLPRCSRCCKFGLFCTQYRLSIKNPNLNNSTLKLHSKLPTGRTQPNFFTLSQNKPYVPKRKARTNSNRGLILVAYKPKNKRKTNTNIPLRIWIFLWPSSLQEWTCNSFVRSGFNYFLHLLGIQADKATKNDRLFLSKVFSQLLPPTQVPQVGSKLEYLPPDLVSLATEAYFYYHNPFFPLFTKHGYYSQPRSYILRLAIIRLGIQFITYPNKELAVAWLDQELDKHVRISRLQPELGTLQCIVIVSSGLYDSPLVRRYSGLFSYATSLATQLGLHQPLPNHLRRYSLERQLTLTVLEYLNNLGVSNFTASYELPNSHQYNLKPIEPTEAFEWTKKSYQTYSEFYYQYFWFLEERFNNYSHTTKGNRNSFYPQRDEEGGPANFSIDSLATDLGILISSLCLYDFIQIYKQARYQAYRCTKDQIHDILLQADKALQNTLALGFSFLHHSKTVTEETGIHLNGDSIDGHTNLFSLFNCPTSNGMLAQFQLISGIRYHFIRLLVIDLYHEVTGPHHLDQRGHSIVVQGGYSALKLVQLMKYIQPGDFNFYPTQLLAAALRHLKPLANTPDFHTLSSDYPLPHPPSPPLSESDSDINPILNLSSVPHQIIDMVDALFGRVSTYHADTTRAVISRLAPAHQDL